MGYHNFVDIIFFFEILFYVVDFVIYYHFLVLPSLHICVNIIESLFKDTLKFPALQYCTVYIQAVAVLYSV